MVLGIAVDLSALPYLFRLLPGPTPSRRPGQSFPVGPDRVGQERAASRGPGVFSVGERGSESDCGPTTARPSGRTSDQISWPEVPVGDRIVVLAYHCVSGPAQMRAVAAPPAGPSFVEKRVH